MMLDWNTEMWKKEDKVREKEEGVKFPHSPILNMHSVLGWRKQWQKQYIAIEKTDLFTIVWGCSEILPKHFTI